VWSNLFYIWQVALILYHRGGVSSRLVSCICRNSWW